MAAGVDDYDRTRFPPRPTPHRYPDVTESDTYQEARAESAASTTRTRLTVEGERDPYPPTRFDD